MSRPQPKILIMLAAGFAGGLIGSIFIVPFLARFDFWDRSFLIGRFGMMPETVVMQVEEKTVFIPQSDYFSEAIAKTEPRVVAIQSFSGGTLIRSGSGIILTQDGLIGTLNSLMPPSQTIQVAIDGKIYSGKIIFKNYAANLAIISIDGESGLQTVELKSESPALGQKLLVFAKTANFGRDIPLIAEAFVAQIDTNGGRFKINTPFDQFMFGSALVDNSGSVLGLLDFRNQKPSVITAKLLEETLSAALAKRNKPK